MNELIELLMRWQAIEPDRCKVEHLTGRDWYSLNLKSGTPQKPTEAIIWLKNSVEEWDWAVVQRAVQQAIVVRQAQMRCKLENDSKGNWYASIVYHGKDLTSTTQAYHGEAAIALLTAYSEALEELAAEQGNGGES